MERQTLSIAVNLKRIDKKCTDISGIYYRAHNSGSQPCVRVKCLLVRQIMQTFSQHNIVCTSRGYFCYWVCEQKRLGTPELKWRREKDMRKKSNKKFPRRVLKANHISSICKEIMSLSFFWIQMPHKKCMTHKCINKKIGHALRYSVPDLFLNMVLIISLSKVELFWLTLLSPHLYIND